MAIRSAPKFMGLSMILRFSIGCMGLVVQTNLLILGSSFAQAVNERIAKESKSDLVIINPSLIWIYCSVSSVWFSLFDNSTNTSTNIGTVRANIYAGTIKYP